MTLQQLKYAIAIANYGSMNEAARELYISQPNLTKAIRELEDEMKICIFNRSNKGIQITKDGEVFLGYARQVVEQATMLEERYKESNSVKKEFSISCQHYSFAVKAFNDLIEEINSSSYDFSIRESETYQIIEDVKTLKSDLGIIYLSDFNKDVISKILKENNLVFKELKKAPAHVFINKDHPLANKKHITLDMLENYPYLSFEQGEHNSFYFSEEILSTIPHKKNIRVRDRATLFNFVRGLNGYTISSGIIDSKLDPDIVSIPLDTKEVMTIGVITLGNNTLSEIGNRYLKKLIERLQ